MEDNRFDIIGQDPRFRRMPKDERKVKIDSRFEGMFKDKRFKLKYSVDKRGRPIKATTDDNLRRFYEMSESDDNSDDEEEDKDKGNNLDSKEHKEKHVTKQSVKQRKLKQRDAKLKQSSKSKSNVLNDELKSSKKASKDTKQHREIADKKKTSINKKKLPQPTRVDSSSEEEGDDDDEEGASEEDVEEEEEEDENELEDDAEESSDDESIGAEDDSSDDLSSGDEDDDDDNDSGHSSLAPPPGLDLMRGEGNPESSSSDSDSSDSEEEVQEEQIEHGWGEIDKEAPRSETISSRLAVCNMDWDRLKAKDLLVLFNSFKPTGGNIESIKIYPSEYGLQRMKDEDLNGPIELVDQKHIDEDKINTEEGETFRERLRKYQMQRLKYYYAVVDCDSGETANSLYEQCDRLELESSSTRIDLRFIPEDMTFDEHEPKDVATEMPEKDLYEPAEFRTTALHQSKVELTWDETDHVRAKKTQEAFSKKNLEDIDVQAYLASSSGEDDDEDTPADPVFEIEEDDFGEAEAVDDEGQISKYKALLQGINDKEKEEKENKMGVEITWEPGLKETTEELVKKKQERGGNASEMTPWESYLEKKKDKKKQRRDQNKKKTEGNKADDAQDQMAFSDDDLPADVDMGDSFFKDSLRDEEGGSSKHTNPTIAGKKKKRKKQDTLTAEEQEEQDQKKAELELLMMDEDDNKQHFNLKDIMEKEKQGSKKKQRKRKRLEKELSKPDDNFEIDLKDSRFDAIYSNHMYAIDPSASQFKKTKSMDALLMEKQKRRQAKQGRMESTVQREGKKPSAKKDQELSMLVKSIKNKTQQFNSRKSKKHSGR